MEGGSASQVENHDENTNNDTNNDAGTVESSAQSTQTPSTIRFDIAAFTVTFPPAPLPDDLLSDHDEDEEEQEPKLSVCCLCYKGNKKLYIIPPQNKASFHDLKKNVRSAEGIRVPERVCMDCNEILTSLTSFRIRAIQTNSLLYSLARPFVDVSEYDNSPPTGSGIQATPRCVGHRHHARGPNDPSDESNPGQSSRLQCVLHPVPNQPQTLGEGARQ